MSERSEAARDAAREVDAPAAPAPAVVSAERAAAGVRAVAFDCYGTLLQLEERDFAALIHEMLLGHGVSHTTGEEVWEAWLDASRALAESEGLTRDGTVDGPEPIFRPFSETWPGHFARAFERRSVDAIPPQRAFRHLWDHMSAVPAYPEVAEVFAALRGRGYRVAIASNADEGHLRPALAAAGIEAEVVLSSEAAESYKPRRPFFRRLCELLELRPEQILYVGDSPYADVNGANHSGLPVYHVRRYPDAERERSLRFEATWSGPDLRGILAVLPSGAAR